MTRLTRRPRNASHAALVRSCAMVIESLESRRLLTTITQLEAVSVPTGGTPNDVHAQSPFGAISGDGHWVAFTSTASNLVPGDTNGVTDVFLRDLRTNTTTRISVADGGAEGNDASSDPAISSDGRYVAFFSKASNLVTGDNNGAGDVFLYDRQGNGGAGSVRRISVATDGTEADFDSGPPAISADGRYVVFHSNADNLVANDNNNASDVFLVDTQSNTTTLISANPGGGAQGNAASTNPTISADGKVIAFFSNASNFVTGGGDTNGVADVFVYDNSTGTPFIERVSVKGTSTQTGGLNAGGGAGQRVALSQDGSLVAFESDASDLVAGDTNNHTGVFLRDRTGHTTTRVSSTSTGGPANGNSTFPSIAGSTGRYVIYESDASNILAGSADTNAKYDIFLYDRFNNTTRRVSVTSGAQAQSTGNSRYPSISADGQYYAFFSDADNIVANDQNGVGDLFALVAPQAGVLGTPDGNNPQPITAGSTTTASANGTDFGVVAVGGGPVTRTFTIRNDGTAPMHISGTSVTLTGTNAADFTIVGQPGDVTLEGGETTTFDVQFNPAAAGPRSARLSVATDDPNTPAYSFNIGGSGIDPSIISRLIVQQAGAGIAPAGTSAYGNIPVGSPKELTFTVFNASNDVITLQPAAFQSNSGPFEITSNITGPTILASGQSTTFTVRLNTTTVGAATAAIVLTNTDSQDDLKTFTFNLSGTVTVAKLSMTLNGAAVASGQTIAFGNVIKGSTASVKSFVIKNDGDAPLILNSIALPVGYTSSPPLVAGQNAAITIAPGATKTFTFTLNSAGLNTTDGLGAANGSIVITTSNTSAGNFTLNVTGALVGAKIGASFNGSALASGSTITFGQAAVSQTVSRTVTITNSGTANLILSQPTSPTGFTTDIPKTGLTIAPGGSATVTISMAPTAAGAQSGTLTLSFANDPSTSTFAIKLSGTAVAQPFGMAVNGVATTSQAISFGNVQQSNSTTLTRTVTLTNNGAITINLGQVSVPPGFVLTSGLSRTSVAPGASTTFTVGVKPQTVGLGSGLLTIATDESVRPFVGIALSAAVSAAAQTGVAVSVVTLGSKLPLTIYGGQTTGVATVTITNYAATTASGNYKITVYSSAGPVPVAGADKVIGTLSVKLNLKHNAKGVFTVPLKFVTPPSDGRYYVAAVLSGSKVDPVYGVNQAPFTVNIQKYQAKIGQTGTTTGASTASLGKSFSKTITLTNTGNAAINGLLAGDVYLSKDGSLTGAVKLSAVSGLKINLAAKKGSQKVTFSATLPKKLTGGFVTGAQYSVVLKVKKIASASAYTLLQSDRLLFAGKVTIK